MEIRAMNISFKMTLFSSNWHASLYIEPFSHRQIFHALDLAKLADESNRSLMIQKISLSLKT